MCLASRLSPQAKEKRPELFVPLGVPVLTGEYLILTATPTNIPSGSSLSVPVSDDALNLFPHTDG